MASSFGGTIKLTGETEYKKALSSITDNLKVLNSELKVVSSQYDRNDKSVDNLTSQNEVLTKKIKEQEEAVNTLSKALDDAKNETGENSTTTKKWQTQLNNAQAELNKLNKQLNDNVTEIEKATSSTEDLGEALDDVDTSGTSEGFTVMKGALGDLVANAITGAVSKIGDLVSSLFELSEATEEYRTMNAKLEGSATSFGYSVEYATEKYKDFYAYLGDSQMSTNAITNLMGLKLSQEDLTSLTESAISVWTAYGDSIPIESLTESINETIAVSKITGVLADALNWAGISEDAFNEKLEATTNEQERAKLISETLNGVYGESKTKYDELTHGIQETNRAEVELTETQARIGEALEPVNNAFTEMKNDILSGLAPLVETLAEDFMNLKQWLEENQLVADILSGVAIALAGAFSVLAGALAIQGLVSGVTKAIALLNTTILANPIVLLVSAIVGLVVAIGYLWVNCEEFRNFFINLFETIKSAVKIGLEAISNAFTSAKEWIGKQINNIIEFLKGIPKFFQQLPSNIANFLGQAFSYVSNFALNIANKGLEGARNLFNNIINTIKNLPSQMLQIGKNLVSGIWDGITNSTQWIKNKLKSWTGNVTSFIKSIFGIHSPSTLFRDEIGKNLALGIGEGFGDTMSIVQNDMANAIPTEFDSSISSTTSSYNSNYDNMLYAFKEALKDVKVVMNDREFGTFVVDKVESVVYS
jgi:predicted  nucleic acid-binding Zn-ribbon protein